MEQVSLAELRGRVAAALEAGGVPLGTHYWPASADTAAYETPALYVGQVPEGVTVEGLEVLIGTASDPLIIRTFAGVVTVDRYSVRVVDHDDRYLTEALRALANAFGNRMSTPDVLQSTDRYPAQFVVTITP